MNPFDFSYKTPYATRGHRSPLIGNILALHLESYSWLIAATSNVVCCLYYKIAVNLANIILI